MAPDGDEGPTRGRRRAGPPPSFDDGEDYELGEEVEVPFGEDEDVDEESVELPALSGVTGVVSTLLFKPY